MRRTNGSVLVLQLPCVMCWMKGVHQRQCAIYRMEVTRTKGWERHRRRSTHRTDAGVLHQHHSLQSYAMVHPRL